MKKIQMLKDILLQENEIYKKILELANKKTQLISEDNIDEIQKITKLEEQYVQDAKILEYKREDRIAEIEKELSIEKVIDISTLLSHILDEELRKELQSTKDEFAKTLTQLKTVNDLNNILIKDALEYIGVSLNLMTAATSEGTYGSKSGEIETQNRNLFDIKG
ncbi:flagellar protein FlgN [Gottschalkia acidurici]|uniref:flagellar protein FlgN n=1 Tax=Clostridium acidurici TaxID=1556 RepID=UPI0002F84286|nr:flagellar protein FlgN [Gottschalkia acidurici]